MRISTSTIYQQGAARISDLQSSLVKTQQQLSTGRRILTPADDPVAAARALDVTQSQSVNAQYATNRQTAVSSLTAVEGSLTSVTSLLQDVRTLVISAGNGALSDADRGYIAASIRGRFDDLLALANASDGAGNYLFSGYQTAAPPFNKTSVTTGGVTVTGAQYVGDQGQRMLQVDSSRQLAISASGQAIFQPAGKDIFKTLNDLATLLETPGTTNLASGLSTANGDITQALDNVLKVRASVGSRLKELDSLDSAGSSRDIQYSQTLSWLQDVDYAKAISQLSQQQTTLQAAQQSFVKIAGLSLFNYL
ncbi:flagellar hook-filament junction protein FlgL [Sulfuriferula plumbiphila]|uniref:Flagellar hook-filament junction protein FlgL n=1 Tax=Sulfuriferula plumbiphila TaxID=171865 RepID=A0A512L4E1_9PROT|nr:flagellar hook-associated protein FlgL [Sulfuriferula plumbiphila]BBP03832.1 flagellar hook-filament junction protein FlgL [Sulfuriferula plumbiphila]GEP29339.1 flagellar hook-filament junction protein FlgL [Sulfuriferula plumbiphila]